MNPLRKGILLVLALVLILVMVFTWGSIGSAAMLLCLILMGASLLYQHFLTNRDEDSWQTE